MKRMLNNKLPMVITCWILVIGMILTASPAFSWERNSSQDRDRTYENDRSSDRDRSNNWGGYGDRDRSNNWDGYGNRDRSNDRNGYNDRNGNRDRDRSQANNRSRNVRVVQVQRRSALPAIVATGIVAGITFSLLSRNNAPAVQVTTPSTCPTAAGRVGANGAVVVTAALLNLRSGPGLNNPCVGQLRRGARLSIMSTSTGWYYVNTSGGVSGWVMAQYTSPAVSG